MPNPLRTTVLPSPKTFHAKPAWGDRRSSGVPANSLPTVGAESVAGFGKAECTAECLGRIGVEIVAQSDIYG